MTNNELPHQRNWLETARTLSEALPFLQKYDHKVVVIKFGGHAMGEKTLMQDFARDIVLMKQCGVLPVVVHGGGPQIGNMLARLQIKSEFLDGLRVTDSATIEVVEMVLAGSINKEIVTAINQAGGNAVGLTGKDGNLIQCEKEMRVTKTDSQIEKALDLGFVGRPVSVQPDVLKMFHQSDFIPVIAPIGFGADGQTYNINGDTAAGAIAGALKAKRLLLLTDVSGVKDNHGNVLTNLNAQTVQDLIHQKVITGGMIPKVNTALDAVAEGVEAARALHGARRWDAY
jgi:acetylglutamate kinase